MVLLDIFAATAEDGFRLFSPTHLVTIALIVAACVGLYFLRNVSDKAKYAIAVVIGVWAVADEIVYQLWRANVGIWDRNENLIFHLCTLLLPLTAIALILKSDKLFQIIFYWVFVGPVMSILTPDLDSYGFPHYRYFQFFFTHAIPVLGMLWLVFAYGFRPRFRSVWTSLITLTWYAAFVFIFNNFWGSNYIFINGKLPTASALDLLPAWPWYLIVEFFGIGAWFALSWLPFGLVAKREGISLADQILGGTAESRAAKRNEWRNRFEHVWARWA